MSLNHTTNPSPKPVIWPGITEQTILANGIRRVGATEAAGLCGLAEPGIWIPYQKLDGNPIREENREFGRLRLDSEIDNRRYHSRAGTRSHLYQPARLVELLTANGCWTLYLTEGEKKALAACEHGVAAAGVSGISNAAPKGRLVDELQLLLTEYPMNRVVFIGDSDVGLNAEFSRAMARLANALPEDVELAVIAPGLSAPAKGFDDLRAALGDGFAAYWANLAQKAVEVPRGMSWETLALTLLKREAPVEIAAAVNGQPMEAAA